MSEDNTLVGYLRRGNDGDLKLSINLSAFTDCETYTTSDGQVYVPLVVLQSAVERVMAGERAITTVFQRVVE